MFQALLAERFKLAAHKESRLQSGYALVVDKNGPKFKKPILLLLLRLRMPAKSHSGQRRGHPRSKGP
jgi:uncharacterized protein (TIGR03435 family)